MAVAAGGQAETREARLRLVRGGERRLAWDGIPANADALMLSGSGRVTSLISLTKLSPVFVRPSRGQSGHLRAAGRGDGRRRGSGSCGGSRWRAEVGFGFLGGGSAVVVGEEDDDVEAEGCETSTPTW